MNNKIIIITIYLEVTSNKREELIKIVNDENKFESKYNINLIEDKINPNKFTLYKLSDTITNFYKLDDFIKSDGIIFYRKYYEIQ